MLVCPVCHHELPAASIHPPPSDFSTGRDHPTPLCHVTPQPSSCRLRPSCHVFPYTCGCSLSHRTSLPSNSLYGNQSVPHHHTSDTNTLDLSSLKIANNFTSCPTSPLPNAFQESNPFQHLNSKLMSGGSNCSIMQPQHTTLHRGASLGHSSFQCPEEQLAASHHMCHNATGCSGAKPGFRRQSSCPNAAPCLTSLSCVCVPQPSQEIRYNTDISRPMPPSTIITTTTTSSVPHKLTTQIQFQYPDHHRPSKQPDNNIVILNTTGSGGFIIENKIPSRTNSPDINISLSNNKLSSGRSSPENGFVIDREQLMKTLASLPPMNGFNQAPGPSDNSHHHCSNNNCQGTMSQNIHLSEHQHQPIMFNRSTNSSPLNFDRRHSPESSFDSLNERVTVTASNGSFSIDVQRTVLPSPICERLTPTSPFTENWTSEDDTRILRNAKLELEESGFYYGSLTWRESNDVLAGASEGSFLLRDSFSERCLYALSIKTAVGPTSVRIEYERGKFMLQSENRARLGVPQRCCVVGLIQAYIEKYNPGDVWVDHSGKTVSAITVTKPLRKSPPSLQHLARLSYHSKPQIHSHTYRNLPQLIKNYLSSYSHTC